jgi:hypothetical protein
MSLPGFTAEVSLYKTSKHYQMIGTVDQNEGSIYPAQSLSNLIIRCQPCHPYYDRFSTCNVYQRVCDLFNPPGCRLVLVGQGRGPCCEYLIL